MGVVLRAGGRKRNLHRKNPKSENIYLRLLVRLYKFLARRTRAPFNRAVLRRLVTPVTHRPVISLTKVVRFSKSSLAQNKDRVVVVVGQVTDDQRTAVPAGLKVCALRVTETLRARIVAAGGEVLTFDQLALQAPRGSNCVLIRGKKTARVATRYFGAAGKAGSHARPRVINRGRKVENARGRH